jgi:hypothetical protein
MTARTSNLVTPRITNHDQAGSMVVNFCLVTLVIPLKGDKQMTNQAGGREVRHPSRMPCPGCRGGCKTQTARVGAQARATSTFRVQAGAKAGGPRVYGDAAPALEGPLGVRP